MMREVGYLLLIDHNANYRDIGKQKRDQKEKNPSSPKDDLSSISSIRTLRSVIASCTLKLVSLVSTAVYSTKILESPSANQNHRSDSFSQNSPAEGSINSALPTEECCLEVNTSQGFPHSHDTHTCVFPVFPKFTIAILENSTFLDKGGDKPQRV